MDTLNSLWTDEEDRLWNISVNHLWRTYREKVLPLEKDFRFHDLVSPPLTQVEITWPKARFLLVGPPGTGKTTLLRRLIGASWDEEDEEEEEEFGLPPHNAETKTRFITIVTAQQGNMSPVNLTGPALVEDPHKPYHALGWFPESVLRENVQCVQLDGRECLDHVDFVDTPSITSNTHSHVLDLVHWFAERADRVLVALDPTQLDLSLSMQRLLRSLYQTCHDKVRLILNKSDNLSPQELLRVYGALYWVLSRVLPQHIVTPRIFIVSFQPMLEETVLDTPLDVIQLDTVEFLQDLKQALRPEIILMRRAHQLLHRVRQFFVLANIFTQLRRQLPLLCWDIAKKEKQLMMNLPEMLHQVATENHFPVEDLPSCFQLKAHLKTCTLRKVPLLNPRSSGSVRKVISTDIPHAMFLWKVEDELVDEVKTPPKGTTITVGRLLSILALFTYLISIIQGICAIGLLLWLSYYYWIHGISNFLRVDRSLHPPM